MKPATLEPPRERKTAIIHFRVPASVEASLAAQIDPASGIRSVNDVARALTLQALAERERQRQLRVLDVYNLKEYALLDGDAGRILPHLPARAFQCCITSPPYYKKRDYGHPDQLGQESTPEHYVSRLADIFDQVKRVLVPTGSLWVNLDDTYKNKELLGVPWLLAFELKRRGWYLRGYAIWWKSNSTPEPAKNRMSRYHEYFFHFTRQTSGCYFDMDAVREPHTNPWALDCLAKFKANPARPRINLFNKQERHSKNQKGVTRAEMGAALNPLGKHKRDVFTDGKLLRLKADLPPDRLDSLIKTVNSINFIVCEDEVPTGFADLYEPVKIEFLSLLTVNTNKFRGQHYASYPKQLVSPAIVATCPPNGVVLDPFCGSGTTGIAALEAGRRFVGIDVVPRFIRMAHERLKLAAGSKV